MPPNPSTPAPEAERVPDDPGLEWASAYLEHWIEESLEGGPPPPPFRGRRHSSFHARGSRPHRHRGQPHRPRALHGSFAGSPASSACVSSPPTKGDGLSGEKRPHEKDDSAHHVHTRSHRPTPLPRRERRGLSQCDASLDVLLSGTRVDRPAPSITSDPPQSRANASTGHGRHGRGARRRTRSLDAGLSRMAQLKEYSYQHTMLNKFFAYCSALDGEASKTFDTVRPFFEDLFHPDAQIATGNGTVGLSEWRAFVEKFAGGGGKVDLLGFEAVAPDAVVYSAKLTFPDGKVERVDTKGTFVDGQLYRVEPADPDVYNTDRLGEDSGKGDADLDMRRSIKAWDPPGNSFSSFRRSDATPLLHVHFLSDGQPSKPSEQSEISTPGVTDEAKELKEKEANDTSPVRKDEERLAAAERRPIPRIMYLPWKDDRGVEGLYSGEVKLTNLHLLPHGHGLLKYEHDGTTLKCNWIDGIPSRDAELVPEKSEVKIHPNPRSNSPRSQSDSSNELPAEKSGTFYAPDALCDSLRSHSSCKTTHGSSLAGIPPLPFQLKSFELGDVASSEDMIVEKDPSKALESVESLAIHDFAFVHRTDGTWTYAILANFSDKAGEHESMQFVVDRRGSTKIFQAKHWAKCVRLANANFEGRADGSSQKADTKTTKPSV